MHRVTEPALGDIVFGRVPRPAAASALVVIGWGLAQLGWADGPGACVMSRRADLVDGIAERGQRRGATR